MFIIFSSASPKIFLKKDAFQVKNDLSVSNSERMDMNKKMQKKHKKGEEHPR
jgi:hypothetical protein